MANAKPTPKPWHVEKHVDGYHIVGNNASFIGKLFPPDIDISEAETNANAALIELATQVEQAPIIVTVSGGVVQDVSGMPSGVSVHVHDYDVDGQEPIDLIEENDADVDGFDIKTDVNGDAYFLGIW